MTQALHLNNGQTLIEAQANHNLQQNFVPQNAVAEANSKAFHAKRASVNREVERTLFDTLRLIIKSDWLRRAFIIFVIASVIGFVASVYFYFAGQRDVPPLLRLLTNKDGVIGGAVNVNLRLEPAGNVLKILPQGTKVRALEERDGWVRVKVTELPFGTPADGTDTGWVIGKYIQFE